MDNTDSAATRLERRKGISFNFELKKSSTGYPVFLRITEDGKHLRYKTTVTLTRKSDWDSAKQKIKYTEPRRRPCLQDCRAYALHPPLTY